MARFQSIARDVQLATAGLEPQNIAAALAQFARDELAKAIDSGEGSPDYDIYVNGTFGASESSVVPPGPILYVFSWWADIVQYALQYLIERSPADSGRYKASWVVMANNSVVANLKNIPATSEVTLVNVQPYHRKIDVGHMQMRVPPFIIEDARKAVMAVFGNIVKARRTLIQLPGGYVLKGHFRRGVRKHSRPGLRPDTRAGAAMTYPALILSMKAGSVGGGGGSGLGSGGGGGHLRAGAKPGFGGEKVYAVNVHAIDNIWKKDTGFHISSNPEHTAFKYGRAKTFMSSLRKGDSWNTPSLGVSGSKIARVGFTDGRHRFAAMRDLGMKTGYVSMDRGSYKLAKKFGLLAPDTNK